MLVLWVLICMRELLLIILSCISQDIHKFTAFGYPIVVRFLDDGC